MFCHGTLLQYSLVTDMEDAELEVEEDSAM